jgi:hypothetical protein
MSKENVEVVRRAYEAWGSQQQAREALKAAGLSE